MLGEAVEHGAEVAHQSAIHVELAAERVGEIWGIPITNTLITSWAVMVILTIVALLVWRKINIIPGRLQLLLESLVEYVYDFAAETLESRTLARRFLPLLLTLFLFIFVSNVTEFTPGIGSVGIFHGDEFSPLFRSVNTDLNVTLALAIIAVIVIEVAGIMALGVWRYAGKFINFSGRTISQRLINFAVGIIELVSELSRFVSFSFRLFGNVFAGEVLLAVIGFFVPYFLPVPMMAFEMFVGFVQAAVFPLLTLFFIKLAIAEPHGEEHDEAHGQTAHAH